MDYSFLQGMISIANLLISLFVLIFAIFFLGRMHHHRKKKPWVFLFGAVIVYFALQVANILSYAGLFNMEVFRFYFDLIFLAIVLFTFVLQYNLVLHSDRHQLHKKIEEHRKGSKAKK